MGPGGSVNMTIDNVVPVIGQSRTEGSFCLPYVTLFAFFFVAFNKVNNVIAAAVYSFVDFPCAIWKLDTFSFFDKWTSTARITTF